MKKISEIWPEINFTEYKLIGGHFDEAMVYHKSFKCDTFVKDVTDAYDLLQAIKEHHSDYH